MANQAQVIKTQKLSSFKVGNEITKIEVFQARKSQKFYACDQDGEYLFHLADDYAKHRDNLVVLTMQQADEETGEMKEWYFCCGDTPREVVDTL